MGDALLAGTNSPPPPAPTAATACAPSPHKQAAGYPPDEAASRERLEYRLQRGAQRSNPQKPVLFSVAHSSGLVSLVQLATNSSQPFSRAPLGEA